MLERIIKLNNEEIVIAGNEKVYLIDINNYLILNEINSDYCNNCILKLSNNLFLIGDVNGTITQYKIENKKLFKESYKNKSHEKWIIAMTNNEIKIWKK